MWRIDGDRGAVAVLVAILMTALLGFAAIGVDVANMASDKQQLQNGADAGALAVAQDCLLDGTCTLSPCTPGSGSVSEQMARANRLDGVPNTSVTGCVTEVTPKSVTVRTCGDTNHWFADILGTDQTEISAEATASLQPYCGGGELPLIIATTFIQCLIEHTVGIPFEFDENDIVRFDPPEGYVPEDHVVEIYLPQWADPKKDETYDIGGCYSAIEGNWIPGGFGWLDTVPDSCEADTYLGTPGEIWNDGSPGAAPPTLCKGKKPEDALPSILAANQALLIPLFDTPPADPGNNGTYVITGFVGFHLVGYDISTAGKVNASECGNKACIRGFFEKAAATSGATCDGAPDLGTYVINLTK